jgi:hypothetical protein
VSPESVPSQSIHPGNACMTGKVCGRALGPDRVGRKNIVESRDFVQKDLDTLWRARADLHATLAQIDLQIDDDGIGARPIHVNAKNVDRMQVLVV